MIMLKLESPKYFGIVFLGIRELCIIIFMGKLYNTKTPKHFYN